MLKGEIGTIWSNGDFDVVFPDQEFRAMCFRAAVDVDFEVVPGAPVEARVNADTPARVVEVRLYKTEPRRKGLLGIVQSHLARA